MNLLKPNGSSFKIRLLVALLMLVLGFIGVIVTDIKKDGAWYYWRFLAVVYAVLSIGLSSHLKRKGWKTTIYTIWHEIAHWVGLVGAIMVASYFVQVGLISRFEASLLTLLLLALATYLAGIYTEPTMVLIGILLGVFAAGIAFVDEYLFSILLPVTLAAAVVLALYIHHKHKKTTKM